MPDVIVPLDLVSLSLPGKPVFVKVPEDQIGLSGGVASFVCQATGEPKPRITWMKKGKKVSSQRFEVRPGLAGRAGQALGLTCFLCGLPQGPSGDVRKTIVDPHTPNRLCPHLSCNRSLSLMMEQGQCCGSSHYECSETKPSMSAQPPTVSARSIQVPSCRCLKVCTKRGTAWWPGRLRCGRSPPGLAALGG